MVTETGVQLMDSIEEGATLEEGSETEDSADGIALWFKRDLENSLVSNLEQLEAGLRLYEHDGIERQQFETNAVERLDILAIDKPGNYVEIELKAGEADD